MAWPPWGASDDASSQEPELASLIPFYNSLMGGAEALVEILADVY
jgi:hypothetical protein